MIVLIADDIEDNRELLCRLVQLQGYESITATHGLEAVEQARKHHPDFIFMDISMPVMSGYEAVALIRKDLRFADTPIVAFTAHAMSQELDACYEAGCTDVVTKPLDISRIQQLLIQHADRLESKRADLGTSNG